MNEWFMKNEATAMSYEWNNTKMSNYICTMVQLFEMKWHYIYMDEKNR